MFLVEFQPPNLIIQRFQMESNLQLTRQGFSFSGLQELELFPDLSNRCVCVIHTLGENNFCLACGL